MAAESTREMPSGDDTRELPAWPPLPELDALPPGELPAALEQLEADGVPHYDPARFAYIRALLNRAGGRREAVAVALQARARAALDELLADLQAAREHGWEQAQALLKAQPDLRDTLAKLLARHDFAALERLRRRQSRPPAGPLADLVQALGARDDPVANDAGSSEDLAEQLRRQERELLAAFIPAAGGSAAPGGPGELRAARHYRRALQRVGVEQVVSESLASTPEASGPLNPQKLVTRALATLQHLSPASNARLVAYFHTLFHLESLPGD